MTQRSNTLAALSCSLKNHKTIHRIHPPATGPRHARAAVGTGERASARPRRAKNQVIHYSFSVLLRAGGNPRNVTVLSLPQTGKLIETL
jgi:hypothetical protein